MANDKQLYLKAIRAGKLLIDKGDYTKALSAYRTAIGEFPKRAEPYAGLGEACMGLKQLDRALECYKLAARFSGGDTQYLHRVADIQERQGQLAEAGRTYLAIGELLLKQRKLDEAVGNWERAIRLESNLLGAHKRLAMVFQRQNKTKEAVRAYLAIARILQMRGENRKALQMCQAALRLDPNNEDVITAVELIQKGADEYEAEHESVAELEPETAVSEPAFDSEEDELTQTVRQMAAAFEAEREQFPSNPPLIDESPIARAKQRAQEALAAEIFREEDEEDDAPLSKLERDALLGQGMDYESRGRVPEAISCYRKAIDGGLTLPAASFILGMLYLQNGQPEEAEAVLTVATRDQAYQTAVSELLA